MDKTNASLLPIQPYENITYSLKENHVPPLA